jgi:hypothetical protein
MAGFEQPAEDLFYNTLSIIDKTLQLFAPAGVA